MWNWFKNLFFPKVHIRIGVVAPVEPIVKTVPAKKPAAKKPTGSKKPAAKKPTSTKKGTTVPKKGTVKKVVKKG